MECVVTVTATDRIIQLKLTGRFSGFMDVSHNCMQKSGCAPAMRRVKGTFMQILS